MRNSSSTGTLRSSSSRSFAALSTDGVRVLASRRRRGGRAAALRATASATSVLVEAVSSMCPCSPAGSPRSCASQSSVTSSSSWSAGDVRQRIPTWFSPAMRISARTPGSEPVVAKYAKKRGLCQCVIPGMSTSSRSRSTAGERLRLLGRRRRERGADLARLDLREHRALADALEVRRDPVERSRAVRRGTTARRSFRSFCDLRPRARVQHLLLRQPRAAREPDAELGVRERGHLVRVRVDRDQDAGLTREPRVRVAHVEAVGLRVDLERGAGLAARSTTRSMSTSAPGRFRIFRPVRWPMQSTWGLSIAPRIALGRVAVERRVDARRRPSRARRASRPRRRATRRRGCSPRSRAARGTASGARSPARSPSTAPRAAAPRR